MKEVLFATTNPAKIYYYAEKLKEYGYKVYTLSDLKINVDIEENGIDGIENAIIKAKAYHNISKMITIAIDDNLYFEDLDKDKQPGTNVRRVNGKRLNDNELIEYYTDLVKKYGILGERLNAKWIKGIAVYDGKNVETSLFERHNIYFTNKPSKVIHEGYPLNSISIVPKYNKYLSELTSEELESYNKTNENKEIFDFLIKTLERL